MSCPRLMAGAAAVVAPAGLIASAVIVGLSGEMASHGTSQSSPRRDGITNAMRQPNWLARNTTIGGAMTDPNCAPALKAPPARERVAAGNRPASALIPAV